MNKILFFTSGGILGGAIIGLVLAGLRNALDSQGPLVWMFAFTGGVIFFLTGVMATQRDVKRKKYGSDWKKRYSILGWGSLIGAVTLGRLLIGLCKALVPDQ